MQFVRTNLMLVRNAVNTVVGYIRGAYLQTEAADNLLTEDSNKLITE